MSVYVSFKIKGSDKILLDYSRNTEVYQELYENGLDSWDKWSDVDKDVLHSAIDGLNQRISNLKMRMAYEKAENFSEWNDNMEYLEELLNTKTTLIMLYDMVRETDFEWLVG